MKADGLYIALSPDGKIKRHLQATGSKIPLEDTTIAEEIISLSEQNHIHLYQAIKEIWALAGQTGDAGNDLDFAVAMESFLCTLRKENIIRHTLLMTQIGDQPDDRSFARWDTQESAMFLARNFSQAMAADVTVDRVLSALSDGRTIELNEKHDMLHHSSAYVTFTFGETLTAEYQFRSEEQYFIFLLQHFILSKPNIAVCQFCGRFFIPKTKKKTLYCDRIVRGGRTCKQVAPYLKRKEKVAASKVLSEFKRVKEMMEKRYDRTGNNKEPSIIDITYNQYYEWLVSATEARKQHLAGELTEKAALAIIYVPTKKELIAEKLEEYTLGNTGGNQGQDQSEKSLEAPDRGSRPVYYAGKEEQERAILQTFPLMLAIPTEPMEEPEIEKETVMPKATSIITSVNEG